MHVSVYGGRNSAITGAIDWTARDHTCLGEILFQLLLQLQGVLMGLGQLLGEVMLPHTGRTSLLQLSCQRSR